MPRQDPFNAFTTLEVGGREYRWADLSVLEDEGLCRLDKLPVSIRVLMESVLRNVDGETITADDVRASASWAPSVPNVEIPFMPSRVVLQDFTGVPAVVDLAALRSAAERAGKDPSLVNPLVPCDLVIDHSVQVDFYGSEEAFDLNVDKEYERNEERYKVLKWAQRSFDNVRIVPPGTGIVHQVNLEYLGAAVHGREQDGEPWAFPDTLVGTDSHTTMIGGIGVVGWGVGGIEAEGVMLGQPYFMKLPEVIGVKLTGKLPEGATATDLVLHITELLREVNVVDKFVEFHGPGLKHLTVADRATISNMAPEQGSTISFFPIDEATLDYLRMTGRPEEHVQLVEAYARAQGIFGEQEPEFTKSVELDLGTVEPSLAGPKRPQDRVPMTGMKRHIRALVHQHFHEHTAELEEPAVARWLGEGGHVDEEMPHEEPGNHPEPDLGKLTQRIEITTDDGDETSISNGSVVIAAITSCTNTSNPSVMVAAGLLARNAVEKGLQVKPYVKTSMAPGSRVVTEYLNRSGLMTYLEKLRFNVVGYGCTTCIGNSGPLPEQIEAAIDEHDLVTCSVLSGNRNFEARIHSKVRANYLASPPLVVAYALAGRMDIDLDREPLGEDADGNPVFLEDLWPSMDEVTQVIKSSLDPSMFKEKYASVFDGDDRWQALDVPEGMTYDWTDESTYIREPPFWQDFPLDEPPLADVEDARVLGLFGDSVTTDHISPAGNFSPDSPAGRWLQEQGVEPWEFNTYGSRRGNHEVMMRGTFANVRIKNRLVGGKEGGFTIHHPTGEEITIFDAAGRYEADDTPLIVIGGKEYGTGSSRDWAAKGTDLLGVKAVLVESYERIHRSNLIGLGVLPLQFKAGDGAEALGLDGSETYTITGIGDGLEPRDTVHVTAARDDGSAVEFDVDVRLDTPAEVVYYRNGGILDTVLRRMLNEA